MNPLVSPVASLLLALGRLRADAETAREILEMLGLSTALATAPMSEPIVVPTPEPPPREPPEAPRDGVSLTPSDKDPSSTEATFAEGGPERRLALRKVTLAAPAPTAVVLPQLPSEETLSEAELPFEPLLRPVVTRSVIGAALVRMRPEGPIDVERLANTIARRRPIRRLPRRNQKSVAIAARVLVDRGPGMAPFLRDANDLSRRVSLVASRDRTEVLKFWQTPFRVGRTARSSQRLPPPARGTVVIALTELGLSRAGASVPDLLEHWLEFDAELQKTESRLVVLVPYPASRWPPALAERLSLVSWDRKTALSEVRAALSLRRPKP